MEFARKKVWVKDLRIWGTVSSASGSPRSYLVQNTRGIFRRNSSHLTTGASEEAVPPEPDLDINGAAAPNFPDPAAAHQDAGPYRTRSRREVNPPRRLIEEI